MYTATCTYKPCTGVAPSTRGRHEENRNCGYKGETYIQVRVFDVCDFDLGRNIRPAVIGRAGTDLVRFAVVGLVVFCLAVSEHSNDTRERVCVP